MDSPSPFTILPGYADATGNTNSCLWRAYMDVDQEIVVVHSAGFAGFCAARSMGRLSSVCRLIVLDGWYPYPTTTETSNKFDLPPVPCILWFPTVGDRSLYPLEAVARRAMVTRKDITVVRGVNFGHNLIYGEFDEKKVRELVTWLSTLPDERASDVDITVTFPNTKPE